VQSHTSPPPPPERRHLQKVEPYVQESPSVMHAVGVIGSADGHAPHTHWSIPPPKPAQLQSVDP
jgi:hypothetical protein